MIGKVIWPVQPQIALGAMALVAFIPQHLAMMSAVNNDALAEAIVALALLWVIRYMKKDSVPIWQFGLIAGLAILCKITIYFLLLLIPLAILLTWTKQEKPSPVLVQRLSAFLLVAFIVGGGWWLRNISAYGFPDFLGLAAHDAVVADQNADGRHYRASWIRQLPPATHRCDLQEFLGTIWLDGVAAGQRAWRLDLSWIRSSDAGWTVGSCDLASLIANFWKTMQSRSVDTSELSSRQPSLSCWLRFCITTLNSSSGRDVISSPR